MYDVCERLRVWYTFGLSTNAVLQRETEGLLAEAVEAYDAERQVARQPGRSGAPAGGRLTTITLRAEKVRTPIHTTPQARGGAVPPILVTIRVSGVERQRHFRLRWQRVKAVVLGQMSWIHLGSRLAAGALNNLG